MFKKIVSICAIVAVISVLSSCFKSKKDESDLIVGTSSGYAPFVSLNMKGEYEGFDIDLAKELATRMGKKLVIKDLGSMTSLLIGLKKGKIDLLIWGLSITKERQEAFELVHYQGDPVRALPLVFWQNIPENIKTIQDLRNYPDALISVEPASSNEKFLDQFDFIKTKPLDKVTDAIMDVKYGKSLATLIDPSLVNDLQQKYPEIKILYVPLDENYSILGNGIGINKKNSNLASQVRDIIDQMKQDGTIKELEDKWNLKG